MSLFDRFISISIALLWDFFVEQKLETLSECKWTNSITMWKTSFVLYDNAPVKHLSADPLSLLNSVGKKFNLPMKSLDLWLEWQAIQNVIHFSCDVLTNSRGFSPQTHVFLSAPITSLFNKRSSFWKAVDTSWQTSTYEISSVSICCHRRHPLLQKGFKGF